MSHYVVIDASHGAASVEVRSSWTVDEDGRASEGTAPRPRALGYRSKCGRRKHNARTCKEQP